MDLSFYIIVDIKKIDIKKPATWLASLVLYNVLSNFAIKIGCPDLTLVQKLHQNWQSLCYQC